MQNRSFAIKGLAIFVDYTINKNAELIFPSNKCLELFFTRKADKVDYLIQFAGYS